MSDTEAHTSDQTGQTKEKQIENKINKEVDTLKYYLEQADDLNEEKDLREIEAVNTRAKPILYEIYNLVSTAQEMVVDLGTNTTRAIRQWTKEVNDK